MAHCRGEILPHHVALVLLSQLVLEELLAYLFRDVAYVDCNR